jgi:hypothetical protein
MLCHVEIISLSQGHIENYVIVKAWLDPRVTIASSSIPSTQASSSHESERNHGSSLAITIYKRYTFISEAEFSMLCSSFLTRCPPSTTACSWPGGRSEAYV